MEANAGFDQKMKAMIASMPRGGTTSLYRISDNHPDCFVLFRKETAYFSCNHGKGAKWIRYLFRAAKPNTLPLISVRKYFVDPRYIGRIKNEIPDCKVILSVRNPLDWIIPLYDQTHKFLKYDGFLSFLVDYPIHGVQETIQCNLPRGHVQKIISAFQKSFCQNLLIYRFEDFRDKPLQIIKAIAKFCGTKTIETFNETKVNASEQQYNRLFYWLSSRKQFISPIDTILPRKHISISD